MLLRIHGQFFHFKLPLSRVIPGTWQDDVEEKATKLALDDLSCESIEQLANHLHKALESTLKSNSLFR